MYCQSCGRHFVSPLSLVDLFRLKNVAPTCLCSACLTRDKYIEVLKAYMEDDQFQLQDQVLAFFRASGRFKANRLYCTYPYCNAKDKELPLLDRLGYLLLELGCQVESQGPCVIPLEAKVREGKLLGRANPCFVQYGYSKKDAFNIADLAQDFPIA